MFRSSQLVRSALVAAGIGTAMTLAAAPAFADQHGTNYCVSGVFAVHESPSQDSPVLTDIHANEVWHHYDHDGNWSVGYIRARPNGSYGYIPLGALTTDLGNGSTATTC